MKVKVLIYLVFLIFPFCGFSQEIPIIKVGEENIAVKKLSIKTEVIGDIAITTFDMHFYNPNNRVLEGELSFPLGENQSVTRFALEINDNLRDAVVVEKEKARVAYETTVRAKIDPALLEQTKGNNYKARIYPIPAKGYKRVVLAFQQKLTIHNNAYYYKLPLHFKNKLDDFTFEITVLNQKNKPVFQEGMLANFEYNSEQDLYTAIINKKQEKITKPILIKIPLNPKKEKIIVSGDYFYFTKKLTLQKRKVALEEKITIFWDASLSQKDKKITAELALLGMYFNKVQSCKVNLVVFNTKIKSEEKFSIKNGDWQLLKRRLENVIYDGASSFNFLATYKDNSKTNILCTDGLNTLSDLMVDFNKKTFIINSARSANHLELKNIANESGGSYLNINQSSVEKAFLKFTEEQLQFLGTNLPETVLEVYPKKGTVVAEEFSISGKGDITNKDLQLKFGYGNKVVKTVSFKLKNKNFSNTVVTKIWAQKKLEYLLKDKEENKRKIITLSKKHQVISPFTSMLILDRVADYVTHKITPPQELKEQYDALIAKQVDNRKDRFNRLQDNLFNSYTRFFDWYALNFHAKNDTKRNINKLLEGRVAGINIRGSRSVIPVEDGVEIEDSEEEITSPQNNQINNNDSGELLDEVVVVGYGTRRESHTTASVTKISSQSLETSESGTIETIHKIYVVDGVLVGENPNLNADEIASMEVLKEASSRAIYGSRGSDGVVIITTKKGLQKNLKAITAFKKLVAEKIELKGWNPDTPYLTELKKELTITKAYEKYLELRKEYGTSPSFYIDVADFFKNKGEKTKAIQILTNVAEIDLDNYELLKALAYKFEEYELYDFAVYTYKEILKLRPEDVQSYRDLALVYEYLGAYQKSIDLLYQIVNGEFLMKDESRRFSGVEVIALNEFKRMLHLYESKLKTLHFDKKFIKQTNTDFRVVIDWNHNDTDIDLWVTDPNNEKCYYSHKKTAIGGLMSDDMTRGFGPEQFVLKKAIEGTYQIKAKYYANGKQKVSGPTFLKVSVFKNYGTKNEIKTTQLIRLEKTNEIIEIRDITF